MSNEVLGSAWVDIKAKTDTLGSQVQKGLGDAAAKGAKAATDATKDTGKKIGAQVSDGLKQSRVDAALSGLVVNGGKNAESKSASIGSRIGSRIKAGFHGARVDNTIASDVEAGGKRGEVAADKSGKKIGTGFRHGFKEGGAGFKEMGAVFLANSGGVLEPLQKIQEQVSGLPGVFDKANKGIGASVTKLGTIVAGVGVVGQVLGGRDVQAEAQLKAAIEGAGGSYEDYKEKVEEAVKSGEKLGDTFPSTVTALNRLTIATHDPEKAFKLLTAAQDISAARHISVEQAALVVGKAVNGNTRGLRAYGIVVDATAKQQTAAAALNAKASGAAAKASTDAHKARVAEQSALEKYHSLISRITIAQTGHKSSTLQVQQATLGATKAQEALSAAVHKHGADSTAARDAQAKLAIAEERLTAVQDKGLSKAKLTVGQQQSLKAAYDAVQKAKFRVANTADAVVSTKDRVVKVKAETKASFVDPVDAITEQANKYLGGQRNASVKGFQGQLRVYGAMIEDKAAEYGQKFGKVLTVAGPALIGVGALIQTGIIGKTGSAIASVGRFGKSFVVGAKDAETGVRAMSKFGSAASSLGSLGSKIGRGFSSGFETVALKAMYAKDAIVKSTAVTKTSAAVEKAAIAVKGFFVATTDAETGATKASTLSVIAQSAATKIAAAATKVWTGIQLAFNVVMSANPIVLVIVAIAALAAGAVYAYTHFKTFHRIVDSIARFFKTTFVDAINIVTSAVSSVVDFVGKHWQLILSIITGPIGAAVIYITTHWDTIKSATSAAWNAVKGFIVSPLAAARDWISGTIDKIVGFFEALPGRISGFFGGMFDGIKDAFKSAINFVIDGWNSLRFGIPKIDSHIPGVPSIGGGSIGVPQIHRLAKGGVTTRATLAEIGEAGPEAILPLSHVQGIIAAGFSQSVAPVVRAVKDGTSKVTAAVSKAIPGSLTAADIATAIAGGPTRGQLGSASSAAARAVIPAQRAYDSAHKADDAARQHVKDIAAQLVHLRQTNALYQAPTTTTSGKGPSGSAIANAQERLSNAIASQGAGSIDAAKARAALGKAQSGGGKSSTHTDTAASKAHSLEIKKTTIALQIQEAQAKKTQAADDARLKSAKTKLDALKTAAKSAADAYKAAVTQVVSDISGAVRGAFTGGADISSLFNFHPGYGAGGTAGAEASLRVLINQDRQFGTVLRALAKKGLNQDMLQQLIAAGPQAGLAIAQQLLADPNAVTTLNSLESDLTSAVTETSTALVNNVLGGAAPSTKAKTGKVAKAVKPPATAAKVAGFAPVPAMQVNGDFIVNNPTDLDKLSQMLYTQQQKTKRATGGARK